MKKIALTSAACLISIAASGCAVEVPMSAFRLAPPDASQTEGKQGPSSRAVPGDVRLTR